MLTADDVRSVPLFSKLAQPELERLAHTSADLHLAAGEYAAHEGGQARALFAVLSGRIEVVRLFDGVERTLGWRLPGIIFGELPIALGTPLYGSYRASEPSRVMRVEIQEYYAIAAAAPEISLKVAALARERIGGMQGIEAEMPMPRVTLVVRGDSLEKSMSRYLVEQLRSKTNVMALLRSEVVAAHGDTHLSAIDIREGKKVSRQDCGGLFIFIGADAETDWLPEDVARDARGYVLTGEDAVKSGRWPHTRDPYLLESSVPGVFACGDVRLSPVKRVAAAVGEGSMAIAFVHKYLQQEAH